MWRGCGYGEFPRLAILGQVQMDSSLSEPGEPRLRIALSCRRTHCIRTPSNRGSKVSNLRIRFAVGVRLHVIRIPNRIAPRDRIVSKCHFNELDHMPCGRDLLLTFKTSKAGKSHLHTPDIRQRESRPTLQSSYSAWGWEAECRDIQGLAGCWCAGTFDLCSPEQIKVDLLRSPQSRATFRVFMGVFELPLV